jgi:hypothetical protein
MNRVFGHYGFSDLGEKGLWLSNKTPYDKALVIGESAIDCISHAQLFPGPAWYASIAGGLSPKQPALIARACVEPRQVAAAADSFGKCWATRREYRRSGLVCRY